MYYIPWYKYYIRIFIVNLGMALAGLFRDKLFRRGMLGSKSSQHNHRH